MSVALPLANPLRLRQIAHLIQANLSQIPCSMHGGPKRCHSLCFIANKLRAEAKCPGTTLPADVCRLYKLI